MSEEDEIFKALQKQMGRMMEQMNTAPMEDFDNLSPTDMEIILRQTFGPASPIQFKNDVSPETFNKSPFFRLFREYLQKIQEAKEVKLTPKGNLPTKICFDLYDLGILKDDHIEKGIVKFKKEEDFFALTNLKILGQLTGVIKKKNNKISLTKAGEKLFLAADQLPLFRKLLETNAFKFNLGFHDRYPQDTEVQYVIGYTFYLLLRYGQSSQGVEFYAGKNLAAFPFLTAAFHDKWSTPAENYQRCYILRVFVRFLEIYGLVEIQREKTIGSLKEEKALKATDLFFELFYLEKKHFKFKAGTKFRS